MAHGAMLVILGMLVLIFALAGGFSSLVGLFKPRHRWTAAGGLGLSVAATIVLVIIASEHMAAMGGV